MFLEEYLNRTGHSDICQANSGHALAMSNQRFTVAQPLFETKHWILGFRATLSLSCIKSQCSDAPRGPYLGQPVQTKHTAYLLSWSMVQAANTAPVWEHPGNFVFTVLLPYASQLRLWIREAGTDPGNSTLHCTALQGQFRTGAWGAGSSKPPRPADWNKAPKGAPEDKEGISEPTWE